MSGAAEIAGGMKTIEVGGRKVRVSVFREEQAARRWAAAAERPTWVVMGDCPEWWTCRPVDAARLERAGYEIAR